MLYIYEQFAQRKFPLHLLDISVYNKFWKSLLQDDVSKNGTYWVQLNTIIVEMKGFGEIDLIDRRVRALQSCDAMNAQMIQW